MTGPSLTDMLEALHNGIETRLRNARFSLSHPTDKGDASEAIWTDLLRAYLPGRYMVDKAHVVDSNGASSQQIDLLIYDRQYTPLIFQLEGSKFVPAESVYAVFEAKQQVNASMIEYAAVKAASVRELFRTTLPVPTVGGVVSAKEPGRILAGILALDSGWAEPVGVKLVEHICSHRGSGHLDMGCIASAGMFHHEQDGVIAVSPSAKATTQFLLELVARLQDLGTVPMIDVRAYARHLS